MPGVAPLFVRTYMYVWPTDQPTAHGASGEHLSAIATALNFLNSVKSVIAEFVALSKLWPLVTSLPKKLTFLG